MTLLAEDVTTTTIAWFIIAAALGGVLLAGLIGLLTASLNHRWQARSAQGQALADYNQRLRQDRREAYAQYWAAWNRFHHDIRTIYLRARSGDSAEQGLGERIRTSEVEWRAAANMLSLLGGSEVISAVQTHIELTDKKLSQAWDGRWQRDEGGAAHRELNNAMRADLIAQAPVP